LNECGKVKVTKQVLICFSIGSGGKKIEEKKLSLQSTDYVEKLKKQ
jgi:hypothetical protein